MLTPKRALELAHRLDGMLTAVGIEPAWHLACAAYKIREFHSAQRLRKAIVIRFNHLSSINQ
jgi:hypothetical protein